LEDKSRRQRFLEYTGEVKPFEKAAHVSINEFIHARALRSLISFPKRVLDIGCGLGTSAILFGRHGSESHGIDIDMDLVRIARQRASTCSCTPYFVVAGAERLPYRAESFDFCIADSVLEHVENFEGVIDEVARVLKVNGLFALCTTNRLHPFQREVKLTSFLYFPFFGLIPSHLRRKFIRYCLEKRPDLINFTDLPAVNWFSHEQLGNHLRQRGFRVVESLDLLRESDVRGIKRLILPIVVRSRILRQAYHIYASVVVLYAVKQ